MTQPIGGYDGPGDVDGDDPLTPITYILERYDYQYAASGLYCRILRNDEPVGSIRVASERELQWLKKRIDGTLGTGDVV